MNEKRYQHLVCLEERFLMPLLLRNNNDAHVCKIKFDTFLLHRFLCKGGIKIRASMSTEISILFKRNWKKKYWLFRLPGNFYFMLGKNNRNTVTVVMHIDFISISKTNYDLHIFWENMKAIKTYTYFIWEINDQENN